MSLWRIKSGRKSSRHAPCDLKALLSYDVWSLYVIPGVYHARSTPCTGIGNDIGATPCFLEVSPQNCQKPLLSRRRGSIVRGSRLALRPAFLT